MSDSEPRWFTESDVVAALDLLDAIELVEAALQAEASGEAATMEKTHVELPGGGTLHAVGGRLGALVGTKTWAHTAGGATPLVVLWGADSGELVAVVEAFALGQLRTSAMSGVATRRLADPATKVAAVVGSGKQALGQVAAMAAVLPLAEVLVTSPTAAHRQALAERVQEVLGVTARAVASVPEAVEGAGAVTTVTRAKRPVLDATMLPAGSHVNAVGAITPERVELAPGVVAAARMVVVDSEPAARRLARELDGAGRLVPLCQVVSGQVAVPAGPGPTVFKAMGIGLADVALAAHVVAGAAERGVGTPLSRPQRVAPRLTRRST